MMNSPNKQQRGVALIMAILMVALATILAVSVASEGYMDQRRTSTVIVLDQAYELGLGAEALIAALMRDDDPKVDSLNEGWASPRVLPVDDGAGEIKGQLEDLQGRFNINNLINPANGVRNDLAVRQFQSLLDRLGIDPKYATLALDWIDADTNPEFPDGAEDATYAGQTPAYLSPNMPITRTSELMSIVGMKHTDYLKLEPYIAALPPGSKLNVCTASGKVLDALAPSRTEYSDEAALAKNRANAGGCFPTPTNVRNSFAKADNDFDKLMVDHPDYLGETTSYFRANILVTIGTTELALYSVLNRIGTGANGKMRVIQRSFGTT
jgi:general secretion pathway protein K